MFLGFDRGRGAHLQPCVLLRPLSPRCAMTELQPPGAGLPPFELIMVKSVFALKTMFTSDEKALAIFEREMKILMRLHDTVDLVAADERVLIDRIVGIEDSSRNWSLYMVLDHLRIVNAEILKLIDALKRGIVPKGEIGIEFYKPDPEPDPSVADDFKEGCYDYLEVLRAHGRLRTRLTFAHPWFGEMDGHKWGVLGAVHMGIHRRQARIIMAKQGVL